jgi:hypothetical protein
MSWLMVHKQRPRITFLALLLVALSGTWAYDLIHVPAQYDCSLPNVRLRGDFCGIPFSVFDHYRVIVAPLFEHVWDGDSQLTAAQAIIAIFVSSGQASLPLLPLLTTLILLLSHDGNYRHFAHIMVLGGTAVFGLTYALFSLLRPYSPLSVWGVWLFVILTGSLFFVELRLFRANIGTADAQN